MKKLEKLKIEDRPNHFKKVDLDLNNHIEFLECDDRTKCMEEFVSKCVEILRIARGELGNAKKIGMTDTTFLLWCHRNIKFKKAYVKWHNSGKSDEFDFRVIRNRITRGLKVSNVHVVIKYSEEHLKHIKKFCSGNANVIKNERIKIKPKKKRTGVINIERERIVLKTLNL